MPENQLLDIIFRCFEKFRYWSMKAIRAEIPQPEVYLKQTLEKVADLHRSGRFSNNWELKPENRRDNSAIKEEKASDFVAEVIDSDEGEDEAMEDVPLQ
jgi:transcription initiation factor TFIIF subunit beta